MHTVSRSSFSFNPDAGPIGSNRYQGGHPDECLARLADPDPIDAHEGLDDYLLDQATQVADEAAAAEITAAIRHAKELLGNAAITVARVLTVNSATGRPSSTYLATVTAPAMMITAAGSSPRDALDNAARRLDRRAGILPAFAGYHVATLAVLVSGWPVRPRTEALAIARRVAIEPAYLAAARSVDLPGLIEARPTDSAATAA